MYVNTTTNCIIRYISSKLIFWFFYLNLIKECDANCLTCDTDGITCTGCANKFYLVSGECVACSSNCSNCVTTATNCISCISVI